MAGIHNCRKNADLNLLCSPQVYFIPHTLNCLLLPMVNKNGKMQTWSFLNSWFCIHQNLQKTWFYSVINKKIPTTCTIQWRVKVYRTECDLKLIFFNMWNSVTLCVCLLMLIYFSCWGIEELCCVHSHKTNCWKFTCLAKLIIKYLWD